MKLNKRKEAPVDINTTLKTLRASSELPFKDILLADAINKHIENIDYRERIFTPDMTIFGFLSQVISEDKSCQAAVGQAKTGSGFHNLILKVSKTELHGP